MLAVFGMGRGGRWRRPAPPGAPARRLWLATMRMARQVLGGVFPSLRASKDLSEDMDRILGTVRVNRKGNLHWSNLELILINLMYFQDLDMEQLVHLFSQLSMSEQFRDHFQTDSVTLFLQSRLKTDDLSCFMMLNNKNSREFLPHSFLCLEPLTPLSFVQTHLIKPVVESSLFLFKAPNITPHSVFEDMTRWV